MATVPAEYHDLFQRKTYGNFATTMPDGTPHVTPVWVDYDPDEGYVLVNTVTGRQKERNVRRNPRVGMCVLDPTDPYRYVSVRGEAVEITTEGAVEHINALARRYMERETYPNLDDEEGDRVLIKVRPEHVVTSG